MSVLAVLKNGRYFLLGFHLTDCIILNNQLVTASYVSYDADINLVSICGNPDMTVVSVTYSY